MERVEEREGRLVYAISMIPVAPGTRCSLWIVPRGSRMPHSYREDYSAVFKGAAQDPIGQFTPSWAFEHSMNGINGAWRSISSAKHGPLLTLDCARQLWRFHGKTEGFERITIWAAVAPAFREARFRRERARSAQESARAREAQL